MKNSMKVIVGAMIVLMASTVSACEKKKPDGKLVAKPLSQVEKVMPLSDAEKKQIARNNLSLEDRVFNIEKRNARIDASLRKARAAAKAVQ